MIDEKFHVSRFAIHAGPATERFSTIKSTSDGLLVSGMSRSFHPWPNGASSEGESTPPSLLTAMLPWEGRTRFHLASSGAKVEQSDEPDRGSFFVTPRSRAASQYTINTNQGIFDGLGQIDITNDIEARLTITPSDIAMTQGDFLLQPVLVDPGEYKALEFMPRSSITDEQTFMDWYQIDPEANNDGDPYPAAIEFFLGGDPLRSEFGLINFEYLPAEEEGEVDQVRYSFPRSKLAGNSLPGVFSSLDLNGFLPRTDYTIGSDPLDSTRDLIQLTLPAPEDRIFYRLGFGN